MNKELFYIVTAALGAYAAWLQIQQHKSKQNTVLNDWFTANAFSGATYDNYGQNYTLQDNAATRDFVNNNILGAL